MRHNQGIKSLILAITAFLPSLFTQAQEYSEPNYTEIKRITWNSKSPNYYPTLFHRYLQNDTTLSLDEYRLLYYGFALQEDFVPYQRDTRKLLDCRHQLTKYSKDGKVCANAIEIANQELQNNPFSITALSILTIAHLQLGDSLSFHKNEIRLNGILEAILSSGDGSSKETPFHVTNIEHEYELINRMGLTVIKDSICNNSVEYLKVSKNPDGETGFFFNFSTCREMHQKRNP